jgi:alkylation response protein AidB-like acyl-CoA dehydrogenase
MSEPGAGSDLASLRTSARLDGDQFVVNGQKIWTTQAHQARWCTLYARTEPDAARHGGISCLILDLYSAGVDVRPIGRAAESVDEFCEVLLDDVRIPAENLLGPLHGGWRVAMESLEHERDMIWINNWVDADRALRPVLDRVPGASHNPLDLRQPSQLNPYLATTNVASAVNSSGSRSQSASSKTWP